MKTIKFLFVFLFMSLFSAFGQPPVTTYWAYWDNDLDGHASTMKMIPPEKIAQYIKDGWFVVDHKPNVDCDDNNDLVFHSRKGWIDNDGDKYVTGYTALCTGSTMPAGYILEGEVLGYSDCNDNDASVWVNMDLYFDNDGDGRINGAATTYCVGAPASYPAKYIPKSAVLGYKDCDDGNPAVWRTICKSGYPGPNYEVCVGNEVSDCGGPTPPELAYSVYPNPVTDRLNITPNENWNSRVEIRLVDQFGRVARVVNNPSAAKGQVISVNTSDLKPGIYNLTIKNGELMATKQIGVKL